MKHDEVDDETVALLSFLEFRWKKWSQVMDVPVKEARSVQSEDVEGATHFYGLPFFSGLPTKHGWFC